MDARPPTCAEPPGAGLRGVVIAAPRSGAGKTTVALGLMRALAARGLAVQPFKCGPDYIDPAFHAAATGRPSANLDTWAMDGAGISSLVADFGAGAGIAIAEGVMGLFDGAAGPGLSGHGSTADLAARLGWPVIAVLDVSGQTETAAAVALGLARYRDDVALAGVILNRVASPRQADLVRAGFERTGIAVLGALIRDETLSLPERHLGLVQAGEHEALAAHLDRLAAITERSVDLDAVIAGARPTRCRGPTAGDACHRSGVVAPPGQRIAVATDCAFSFMYPHLLAGWRQCGAEVSTFSPLADEAPDVAADAVWLPGGYPELHAATLAAATSFKAGLAAAAKRGAAIHGECGGYMVLGHGLEDAAGHHHEMAGLLSLETSFAKRRLHLGYRRATLLATCALGPAGAKIMGHEFHYATTLSSHDEPLLACYDARGAAAAEQGGRRDRVTGTFVHAIGLGPSS